MKIAILSRAPNCYSTRRLREAAVDRGHDVRVLDTLNFGMDLEEEDPELFYDQKNVTHYDAVIPRIGASITYFGTAVVRQFQKMDVYCANTAEGISCSRDKLRSLQVLSSHKIGIPRTTYIRGRKDIPEALARVGGAPVVLKLVEGTQGIGVLLAPTMETATSIAELLLSQKQRVLIQKFVSESRGKDVRAFVVGEKVVAGMRRVASGNEFRSNVHRGGTTQVVKLSPEFEEAAIRATQIMGLTIAGVDMLESDSGPQILEVNSSPGLQGIERCTKVDIARYIIDYAAANAEFPEIDVRQRLSENNGYGVNEIHVPQTSSLVGKCIDEIISDSEDINVLSLRRGAVSIPNPESDRTIEAHDVLVCYGVLSQMRSLVPSQLPDARALRLEPLKTDAGSASTA